MPCALHPAAFDVAPAAQPRKFCSHEFAPGELHCEENGDRCLRAVDRLATHGTSAEAKDIVFAAHILNGFLSLHRPCVAE